MRWDPNELSRLPLWPTMLTLVLLVGCTTVQQSRSLTVYPSDAPVTVTSNADARCWDVFAVVWCRLNVDIVSTGGHKPPVVAEPQAPPEPEPAADVEDQVDRPHAVKSQHTDKTQQLTERLSTLRDLYNRGLISTKAYDQETRKAIKALGE